MVAGTRVVTLHGLGTVSDHADSKGRVEVALDMGGFIVTYPANLTPARRMRRPRS